MSDLYPSPEEIKSALFCSDFQRFSQFGPESPTSISQLRDAIESIGSFNNKGLIMTSLFWKLWKLTKDDFVDIYKLDIPFSASLGEPHAFLAAKKWLLSSLDHFEKQNQTKLSKNNQPSFPSSKASISVPKPSISPLTSTPTLLQHQKASNIPQSQNSLPNSKSPKPSPTASKPTQTSSISYPSIEDIARAFFQVSPSLFGHFDESLFPKCSFLSNPSSFKFTIEDIAKAIESVKESRTAIELYDKLWNFSHSSFCDAYSINKGNFSQWRHGKKNSGASFNAVKSYLLDSFAFNFEKMQKTTQNETIRQNQSPINSKKEDIDSKSSINNNNNINQSTRDYKQSIKAEKSIKLETSNQLKQNVDFIQLYPKEGLEHITRRIQSGFCLQGLIFVDGDQSSEIFEFLSSICPYNTNDNWYFHIIHVSNQISKPPEELKPFVKSPWITFVQGFIQRGPDTTDTTLSWLAFRCASLISAMPLSSKRPHIILVSRDTFIAEVAQILKFDENIENVDILVPRTLLSAHIITRFNEDQILPNNDQNKPFVKKIREILEKIYQNNQEMLNKKKTIEEEKELIAFINNELWEKFYHNKSQTTTATTTTTTTTNNHMRSISFIEIARAMVNCYITNEASNYSDLVQGLKSHVTIQSPKTIETLNHNTQQAQKTSLASTTTTRSFPKPLSATSSEYKPSFAKWQN